MYTYTITKSKQYKTGWVVSIYKDTEYIRGYYAKNRKQAVEYGGTLYVNYKDITQTYASNI